MNTNICLRLMQAIDGLIFHPEAVTVLVSSVWNDGDPLILKHIHIRGQQPSITVEIQKLLHEKRELSRKS